MHYKTFYKSKLLYASDDQMLKLFLKFRNLKKNYMTFFRYDSDWVDRYNPMTDQWRPCSPMSVPRNRVGVAVMDGLLYAVGGSAGAEYHNSVECYDPDQDTWTSVKSMHIKRLGVGVAVVNRYLS